MFSMRQYLKCSIQPKRMRIFGNESENNTDWETIGDGKVTRGSNMKWKICLFRLIF